MALDGTKSTAERTAGALDALAGEHAALYRGAGFHSTLALVRRRVRGEDRFRWLSGMVTNTVNELGAGQGALSLVLNAQGRIQGDLMVWRGGAGSADALELELDAAQAEKLIAHFEKFIIMDDVELVAVDGVAAVGVHGPQSAQVLASVGIEAPGQQLSQKSMDWQGSELLVRRQFSTVVPRFTLWCAAGQRDELTAALQGAGVVEVGDAALETLRVVEGIPRYGVDVVEKDLPQESSLTRALHFSKGCYLGQEIVERIRSRGNVHRHLRQLEFMGELPRPGAELQLDAAPAGTVTSAASLGGRIFGLAMLKAEAETSGAELGYAGGNARVMPQPPSLEEVQRETV